VDSSITSAAEEVKESATKKALPVHRTHRPHRKGNASFVQSKKIEQEF
jgi:hypothetical protein